MERAKKLSAVQTLIVALAGMFLVRIVVSLPIFPDALVWPLSLLTSAVLLAWPLLAFFRGTDHPWKAAHAWAFLIGGAVVHATCIVVARATEARGLPLALLDATQNTAILCWCLGLGLLLGLLVKDKNLLLPIAIFLAGFDMFLVFSPTGPTRRILEDNPEIFENIAVRAPAVVSAEAEGGAQLLTLGFIGPADLLFAAFFFFALHRFSMRVRETFKWIVPVLAAYLIVVLAFGWVSVGPISLGMLPAMVPIGIVVMAVNWREFQLNKEEKASTAVVGLLALALGGYGLWSGLNAPPPEPPAEPESSETAPAPSEPEAMPEPAS